MIKDMSDQDLLAYITDLRVLINNAANIGAGAYNKQTSRKAAKGMGWMLRHLDIAIAVKRQRGL